MKTIASAALTIGALAVVAAAGGAVVVYSGACNVVADAPRSHPSTRGLMAGSTPRRLDVTRFRSRIGRR